MVPPRAGRRSVGGSTAPATPSASATPREGSPITGSGRSPSPDVGTLIEQLNYAEIPRSFKNPAYGKKASNRRPKTAKQIIQIERERYFKPKKRGRGAVQARIDAANAAAAAAAAAEAAASAGTSVDGTPNEGTGRTTPVDGMDEDGANAAAAEEEQEPEVVRKEQYIAYHEYEAPPSLKPAKKYCDVTGLEAPYTDPRSRLRYHNADIYELLKTFSSGAEQEYLSLRGQGTMIR